MPDLVAQIVQHESSEHNHNDEESIVHIPESENDSNALLTGNQRKRKYGDITKTEKHVRDVSPPWKKVAAEGPTSVIVDGRRKSTRTYIPPPVKKRGRPPKQSIRTNGHSSSLQSVHHPPSSKVSKYGRSSLGSKSNAHAPLKVSRRSLPAQPKPKISDPIKKPHKSTIKQDDHEIEAVEVSDSAKIDATPSKRRGRPPKSFKKDEDPVVSRSKFINPILRRQHPKHFASTKTADTFEEWLLRDNPLEDEPAQEYTSESRHRDASIRVKIWEATKEGGALSDGRCTRLVTKPIVEPSPRWGNWDFVTAHAVNFASLMKQEVSSHSKNASRLARAAKDAINFDPRWIKLREAKSAEEVFIEEYKYQEKRYKQLVKDIEAKWAMVLQEVNRIKFVEWEKQQEILGNKALDQMLDQSTTLLQQQFRDNIEDDSSNYQSAALETDSSIASPRYPSEWDEFSDDELTQEQLMQKYGQLPDVDPSDSEKDDYDNNDDEGEGEEEGEGEGEEEENEEEQIEEEDDEEEEEEEDDKLDKNEDDEIQNGYSQHETNDQHDFESGHSHHNEIDDEENAQPLTNGVHKNSMDGDENAMDRTPSSTPDISLDYSHVKLEEVDDALLDSSDAESTEMSDDLGDSESDVDGEDEEEDEDEDEDEDGDKDDDDKAGLSGLLGFYLTDKEIQTAQTTTKQDLDEGLTSDIESSEDSKDAEDGEESIEEGDETSDQEPAMSGLLGFYLSEKEIKEVKEPQSDLLTEDSNERKSESANNNVIELNNETLTNGIDEHSSELSVEKERSASLLNDDNVSTPTTSIIPATPSHDRTRVSPLLRGTLREYQQDGVDWLAKLYDGGRNGILADEMGLGKTIQTIALLAHLATTHHVWGPHLVVVPTSVILNWEMEFKKWCPGFKILTYYGNIEERKAKRRGWTNDDMWNVCITSYQLILQDAQAFKKRSWHYLVLDEAHNIKNFQTQRWQTLLTFKTQARLLLTGTPLQNNLQELWSLLYFLMPASVDGGGFAELETFMNSMKKPSNQILDQGLQQLDAEAQARVAKLHEVLRPYLLRRLKSEVEKQMPAKYEHVVYCRLSKRQRQLYDEFMGRADTKRTLSSGNYMSIINCLMSLRKVCNHPDLFETRQIVTSFAMPKSVVADFEVKELLVRRNMMQENELDLAGLGLLTTANEKYGKRNAVRIYQLQAASKLEMLAHQERQRLESLAQKNNSELTVFQKIATEAQWNVVHDLERRARYTRQAVYKRILFGKDLRKLLTMPNRFEPRLPSRKRPLYSHGDWFLDKNLAIESMFPSLQQTALKAQFLVTKFGAVTPAVVSQEVGLLTLTESARELILRVNQQSAQWDPYHEARIRLSIAFPDKRLLQYDCGKLQALSKLLRELQAGGHRCLIFTQMTKVLDILEQFLNIHGHRYLRLDGATKIEQRQMMTDRFNNDTRILAFILSSRSGGLGINLTGADTVIFYDLDWNPAMDKQCQDRCHRIGQTRDVHIYRFVSEYTIEANILRKSNQKRLLDDVIIQKGEFTTDTFFNRTVSYKDALDDILQPGSGEDQTANEAMDRVLGDLAGIGTNMLETAEDKEDAAAAKVAQKEMVVADDIDFSEVSRPEKDGPQDPTAMAMAMEVPNEDDNDDKELPHVDEYMVQFLMRELKDVIVRPNKKVGIKPKKKGLITVRY